jgi:hypothetical protein
MSESIPSYRVVAWTTRGKRIFTSDIIVDLVVANLLARQIAEGRMARLSHVSVRDKNNRMVISIQHTPFELTPKSEVVA